MKTKSELYYFIGYPRGIKDWLFYNLREQIVLIITNVAFLEEDYIMNQNTNDRFNLRELSDTPIEPLAESSNLV